MGHLQLPAILARIDRWRGELRESIATTDEYLDVAAALASLDGTLERAREGAIGAKIWQIGSYHVAKQRRRCRKHHSAKFELYDARSRARWDSLAVGNDIGTPIATQRLLLARASLSDVADENRTSIMSRLPPSTPDGILALSQHDLPSPDTSPDDIAYATADVLGIGAFASRTSAYRAVAAKWKIGSGRRTTPKYLFAAADGSSGSENWNTWRYQGDYRRWLRGKRGVRAGFILPRSQRAKTFVARSATLSAEK